MIKKQKLNLAMARSYNGLYKVYQKKFDDLGTNYFLFDIDRVDWFKVEKKRPNAYFWYADQKEEKYYQIYDKIYFIENILRKPVLPDMNMYFSFADKVKQWQIFKSLNLPAIPTYIATEKNEALKLIDKIKYPFVLKDPYGYDGEHVFKIEDREQAAKYVDIIFSTGLQTQMSMCKNIFYAQKFVKTEKDLRVVTIGDKVVCAYWRVSEDWRHNIHHGAGVSTKNIPRQALNFCARISRQKKFHWMAYDLFVLPDGSINLVEWSCNFGCKGAKEQGIDIRQLQSKYMIDYFQKKL